MNREFDIAFDNVIGVEGGFANDPDDRGGATMFGITERVARANGYKGEMCELPLPEAKRIAKKAYWDVMRLDAVAAVSGRIAEELFDTGYNMGVLTAGRFFQRALSAFDKSPVSLTVDGTIGAQTLAALSTFMSLRGAQGETVLLRALNALQGVRYIEIAEGSPPQEKYTYGWFKNRVAI